MRHLKTSTRLAFVLACTLGSWAVAAPPVASVPAEGAALAESERCTECHGVDGQSHAQAGPSMPPRLAGQRAEYIAKQLRDFRSGARASDVMGLMARSLDEQQVSALAAYFAGLPAMRGAVATASSAAPAAYHATPVAARSCAGCHGDQAQGTAAAPRLAGQDRAYLERQLRDWRAGWRRNDPAGVMSTAARTLSGEDATELSRWLEGLR